MKNSRSIIDGGTGNGEGYLVECCVYGGSNTGDDSRTKYTTGRTHNEKRKERYETVKTIIEYQETEPWDRPDKVGIQKLEKVGLR